MRVERGPGDPINRVGLVHGSELHGGINFNELIKTGKHD